MSGIVLPMRSAHRSDSVAKDQREAYGSRSANSFGSIVFALTVTPSGLRDFELVLADPVGHDLMEVADEHFLVVERVAIDDLRLEPELRGLERVRVLERVLLERDRGHLTADALGRVLRGERVHVAFEHQR